MKLVCLILILFPVLALAENKLDVSNTWQYRREPKSRFQRPEDILDVIPVIRYLRFIKYKSIALKVEPQEVKLNYRVRKNTIPNPKYEFIVRLAQSSGQAETLIETPIGYGNSLSFQNIVFEMPTTYAIGIKPFSNQSSHNSIFFLAKRKL